MIDVLDGPQWTTRPAAAGHGEARCAARALGAARRGRRAAGRVPLFVVLVLVLASVVAVPSPVPAVATVGTLDLSEVHVVWVFLNGGGDAFVDNVRAELSG